MEDLTPNPPDKTKGRNQRHDGVCLCPGQLGRTETRLLSHGLSDTVFPTAADPYLGGSEKVKPTGVHYDSETNYFRWVKGN